MMRPSRSASVRIRLARRATTSGSSSPSRVSASRLRAPTGVFSSWLTLATKSRRMASRRCRSETSSTMATAPSRPVPTGQGVGPDDQPALRRARTVPGSARGARPAGPAGGPRRRPARRGRHPTLTPRCRVRGGVAKHRLAELVADDHPVLDEIEGRPQPAGHEGVDLERTSSAPPWRRSSPWPESYPGKPATPQGPSGLDSRTRPARLRDHHRRPGRQADNQRARR